MSEESPRKQRIRAVWRASWDRGEVDVLDELLSADYCRYSASGKAPLDRSEFKHSILTTREAFPDLITTVEELVEEGDRMVIRWRSTGTHTNAFLEVPATGRDVEVFGVTFASFADDKIVDEWVTWDPRQLLTALGIITLGEANR